MKRSVSMLSVLFVFLLLFLLEGCGDSTKEIPMAYNVCSQQYASDGLLLTNFPLRFRLPDNHGAVEVTLNAANAGGFLGDSTAAAEYAIPCPPETPLAWDVFDVLLTDAADMVFTAMEPNPDIYERNGDSLMSKVSAAISHYQYKTYIIRVVRYDGTVANQETIPIGKTKVALSSDVEYLEVISYLDVPDMSYSKVGQGTPGKVSYEDLHELVSEPKTDLPSSIPELYYLGYTGGSSVTMKISQGAVFHCTYRDDLLGETGSDYPNGTVYISEFSGKYSEIAKASETIYTMKLKRSDITLPKEDGTEWIENGTKYVYHFSNDKEVSEYTLFCPGTAVSALPEYAQEYIKLITGNSEDTLSYYVMCPKDSNLVLMNYK